MSESSNQPIQELTESYT